MVEYTERPWTTLDGSVTYEQRSRWKDRTAAKKPKELQDLTIYGLVVRTTDGSGDR